MANRLRSWPLVLLAVACLAVGQESDDGGTGGIFVITFHDIVDDSPVASLLRRLDEAVEREADVIVIDLDTPGGYIHLAEEAADAIHQLGPAGFKDENGRQSPNIPTFIYIREGLSAGTYFALAGFEILMEEDATWGICAPVSGMPGQTLDLNQRKKSEAVILSALNRYAATPRPLKYSQSVIKSLVVSEVSLYEVRTDLDETFFWTREELEQNGAEHYVVFEKEILTDTELLLLDCEKAQHLGFTRTPGFASREAAIEYIRQEVDLADAPVRVLDSTAVDSVVGFLNLWWVRMALLIIGIAGLIIELQIPGFGAPGITGLTCLTVFFASSYLAGVADWVSVIFLVLGVGLLLLEFFVIPGFGVVGVMGFISMFAGLFMAVNGSGVPELGNPIESFRAFEALVTVICGLGGAMLLGWVVARFLPKSPVLNRAVHTDTLDAAEGYVAGNAEAATLVGQTAVATTTLRPAGKIKLDDGKVLDAESEGPIIEAGVAVEVVRATPLSITVRERTEHHGA